jgi:hypothetical protein
VNILDESILESQRQLLRNWRIPVRQIGFDIGRKGLKDREILTFLLQLRSATFFTPDAGFFKRALGHARYCLVFVDVRKHEVAIFSRRLLRHPEFDTAAKRMGNVIRVSSAGVAVRSLHSEREVDSPWTD